MWDTLEVNALCKMRYSQNPCATPGMKLTASGFWNAFDKSSKSGEPKLSHMDLKMENCMLIRPGSNSTDPSTPAERMEDWDLILIDWEFMCWLPAWAEVAGALQRLPISNEYESEWFALRSIQPLYLAEASYYIQCMNTHGGCL